MDTKVQVLAIDQLSPGEQAALETFRGAVQPPDIPASPPGPNREWAGPSHRVLIWDGNGRLVTHAGLLVRRALANEQPVRVGGIGGVMTLPEMRRQGLAAIAVASGVEFFRQLGDVDFALLVCKPHLLAYYGRLGWRKFSGRLLVRQWGKTEDFTFNEVMTYPIQYAPEGVIDLLGPPW
ncbi:MAG: GNAT family N-acetyltransferase [Caldilineaceae bacterium]